MSTDTTLEEVAVVCQCVQLAQGDSGGSVAMRCLVLSLYNSDVWRFDLHHLWRLDDAHRTMAMSLLHSFMYGVLRAQEIHQCLDDGSAVFSDLWDAQVHSELAAAVESPAWSPALVPWFERQYGVRSVRRALGLLLPGG